MRENEGKRAIILVGYAHYNPNYENVTDEYIKL